MSPVLTVVAWLLVPAAALPIITGWVLRNHLNAPSAAARDRSHLALVLALLGVVTALLALNRLLGWNLGGEVLSILFALILLAVDVLSGKWLYEYLTGGFDERVGGGPETEIEHEDRLVGDERRRLQDEALDDEEDS